MNTSQLTWNLFWLIEHHLKLWKHFHLKILLFDKLVFSFYYGSVYHFLKSFYNKSFDYMICNYHKHIDFHYKLPAWNNIIFHLWLRQMNIEICLTVSTIWCIFSPWIWSSWTSTTISHLQSIHIFKLFKLTLFFSIMM